MVLKVSVGYKDIEQNKPDKMGMANNIKKRLETLKVGAAALWLARMNPMLLNQMSTSQSPRVVAHCLFILVVLIENN